MPTVPRDLTDLYLAPLVLAVDARIEELGRLNPDALILAVEQSGDKPIMYRTMREEALISTIQESIDYHGWSFTWDERGLRLTHDGRTLVLGIPPVFNSYLSAPHEVAKS